MRIAINSLSDYNAGSLVYQWFDVEDYDNLTEFQGAIQDWLGQLNAADGGSREEWSVGDTDTIPDAFVSEYGVNAKLWDYIPLCTGEGAEVVDAAVDCEIPLDRFHELYIGSFNCDEAFAMNHAENIGLLENIPQHIAQYFDWSAYARDLMFDFSSSNGHYFRPE